MKQMQLMLGPDDSRFMLRMIAVALCGDLTESERRAAVEMDAYLRWRYARAWGQMPLWPPAADSLETLRAKLAATGQGGAQAPAGEAPRRESATEHGERIAAEREARERAHALQSEAIERLQQSAG